MDLKDCIQRGDAEYVQIIYTSTMFGMFHDVADDNIHIISQFKEITSSEGNIFTNTFHNMYAREDKRHCIVVDIFFAICTRQIYLIADTNGKGKVVVSVDGKPIETIPDLTKLPPTQILVGVYGTLKSNKERRVELDISGKEEIIKSIINNYKHA